jgi:hypothetical protein
MSDFHKLAISAPDGLGATATLDGQPIRCQSILLRCCEDGSNVISAVITFDAVSLEFDGLADVAAKIVRD